MSRAISRGRWTTLAALAALAVASSRPAAMPRYSEWSEPINLGPVVNSAFNDSGPNISKDRLSLYFVSTRSGGVGGEDLWVSQRASLEDPWEAPTNLGPTINTGGNERVPAFSRDGHWMFFASSRPGGSGGLDIWVSWRKHVRDDFGWQAPVNLGPGVNGPGNETGPTYFEDDETGIRALYFNSSPGGPEGFDIYVSQLGADGSFGPAVLVPELSTPVIDARPFIRFDGLEMFLQSNRPGTVGSLDLWVATRETVFDFWSAPVNLGPVINTAGRDETPAISSDRQTLYFFSDRPGGVGGWDLYVTTRTKLPD